ncbi:hypothetical protein C8Q76DRAFT_801038 [Earliella scabrosa]|nr:hypothetical protein C8Q76DRAFT_801038 [Earliella scabrosa]
MQRPPQDHPRSSTPLPLPWLQATGYGNWLLHQPQPRTLPPTRSWLLTNECSDRVATSAAAASLPNAMQSTVTRCETATVHSMEEACRIQTGSFSNGVTSSQVHDHPTPVRTYSCSSVLGIDNVFDTENWTSEVVQSERRSTPSTESAWLQSVTGALRKHFADPSGRAFTEIPTTFNGHPAVLMESFAGDVSFWLIPTSSAPADISGDVTPTAHGPHNDQHLSVTAPSLQASREAPALADRPQTSYYGWDLLYPGDEDESLCEDMEVVIDRETRLHDTHATAQQEQRSVTSMSLETAPLECEHSPSPSDDNDLQDYPEVTSMLKHQRAAQR